MLRVLIILPFLIAMLLPVHRLPIPSFLREWIVALCMIVGVLLWIKKTTTVTIRFDSMVIIFALLLASALLQVVFGIATASAFFMAAGYIVMAFIAYQVGYGMAGTVDRTAFIADVCVALLLAALFSCLCAALQLTRIQVPFELVYPPSATSVYGNLAQANHFNDLLWLGAASSFFLIGTKAKVVRQNLLWVCVLILMVFSVLSASRTGFLYGLALAALPWILKAPTDIKLKARKMMGGLFVIYILVFIVFTKEEVSQKFGFESLAGRSGYSGEMVSGIKEAAAVTSNDSRLDFWRNVATNFSTLGSGAGNFRLQMLKTPDVWQSAGLRGGGFEHAHNIFLDVGAEYGWIVLLAVLILGIRWLWSRKKIVLDDYLLWACSVILIVGIHALLEYPLYYMYFLIPFCLALGVVGAQNAQPVLRVMDSRLTIAMLFAVLVSFVWVYRDFQTIEDVFFQFQFGRSNTQQDKREAFVLLDDISSFSPVKPYAGMIKAMLANPEDVRKGVLKGDCGNVARVWISPMSLINCAASHELAGEHNRARMLVNGVCNIVPQDTSKIVLQFDEIVGRTSAPPTFPACLKTL